MPIQRSTTPSGPRIGTAIQVPPEHPVRLLKSELGLIDLAGGQGRRAGDIARVQPSYPIRDRDIATQYLRLILNVIGITDVTFIAAGGAMAVDLGEVRRDDFLDRFQDSIEAEAN